MKANIFVNLAVLACFLSGSFGSVPAAAQPAQASAASQQSPDSQEAIPWPAPGRPIPHHDVGHLSNAKNYTTQVQAKNEAGVLETATIRGLDAYTADGLDPLAGNYNLVTSDKVLRSGWDSTLYGGAQLSNLETLSIADPIATLPSSNFFNDLWLYHDIAAGDLNNDGTAEQIYAWMDYDDTINLSIGELPGSAGRSTSAPAAVVRTGAQGSALSFNGTSQYVSVPNAPGLNPGQITVALWARSAAANWNTSGSLVSKRDAYILHPMGGTRDIAFVPYIGTWKYATFTAPPGFEITAWHHYAGTFDGHSIRLYVDGQLVAAEAEAGSINTADSGGLFIGRDDGMARFFGGSIDDVRIWNRALTQPEIQSTLYFPGASPAGLAASWQFDEGTGNTAADSSGNGHTGVLTGSPQWAAPAVPPKIDLLVRGYDDALWHCLYDVDQNRCAWDKGAGGLLLSAPAALATGPGQFEVYAILYDNRIHRRTWSSSGWSASWEDVDVGGYWPAVSLSPLPELAAPAVVRQGNLVDLFRKGPDNTLRWRHYNGSTWDASWTSLGGFLASDPAAIVSGTGVLVFAQDAEGILWTFTCSGSCASGSWQRLVLAGMPADVRIASAPALLSPSAGLVNIYVRGSDGHLYQDQYTGSPSGSWSDAGGALDSAIGAALLAGEPYLFAQTNSGGLQSNRPGAGWEDLAGGLAPCCKMVDTGLAAIHLDMSTGDELPSFQAYSLDLETGFIRGDGRSQMVLGYASAANTITIALYDISASDNDQGFTPVKLASTTLAGTYFRIATGDFVDDPYGLDDIAVVYINGGHYGTEILTFNRQAQVFNPPVVAINDWDPPYTPDGFAGWLNVASGDFDSDGKDELAMNSSWAQQFSNDPGTCETNHYYFTTHIFELFYAPESGYTLEIFSVDKFDAAMKGSLDASRPQIAITLTAGDVDGDRKDELLRTWPDYFAKESRLCYVPGLEISTRYYREFQVIDLPSNATRDTRWSQTGADDPSIKGSEINNVALYGETNFAEGDRLVTGDFDRDAVEEILVQEGVDWDSQRLRYYKFSPPDTQHTYYHYDQIAFVDEPRHYMSRLVAGDFTGESLRVGPPSYRVQNQMTSPIAFLNLPPMHRDIIGDQEITTNLTATAVHTTANSLQQKSSTESKRDWTISAGVEAGAGAAGSKVTASLSDTYGENFSKSASQINSSELSISTTADISDQVIYNGTDYGIWEYPVYGVQHDPPADPKADTIAVVFPLVDPITNQTANPTVTQGGWCDENFYAPSHQTFNVWSYDMISDNPFKDREVGIASLEATGGTTITLNMETGHVYEMSNSFHNQISAGLEYTYENELNVPLIGKAFDFSFRGYVNGSYSVEGIRTLSTEYVNTSNISVTSPSDGTYAMKTYLYWAKGGYLVVDYRTNPGSGGIWALYDKPDPAFILPWYGFPDEATGQFPPPGQPDAPPCSTLTVDKQLFTHDIQITPLTASMDEKGEPYVENEDMVKLTATVRNFSAVTPDNTSGSNIYVKFYLGEPGGSNEIGQCSILRADLARNKGPQSCSTNWVVSGASGEERIYAVIDPGHLVNEMHDEGDVIDNNTGYGLLYVASADYLDPGQEPAYQSIIYKDSTDLGFSLYLPTGQGGLETIRYELVPTTGGPGRAIGSPIQVLAYRGGEEEPEDGHQFGDIPAVLTAFYRDSDLLSGIQEGTLKLYRKVGSSWQEATCPGQKIIRFPEDNRISVPVCQAGTFILTDYPFTLNKFIYLPTIKR